MGYKHIFHQFIQRHFIVPIYQWTLKHRLLYPHVRFWIVLLFAMLFIWFLFALPTPLFNKPYSTIIDDKDGHFLSAKIADDYQWRFPVSDSIPYKFQETIRCFEDEYFYYHPGINPFSLARSLFQMVKYKKVVSGGSTISMQVIRLSLNNQDRNVLSKTIEIILAIRLELSYSKDEIINLYASHAPFGGNVVGLEAAAWRYYNRPASKLSWGETAALAVLPNAPSLVFPGKNHAILLKKRNKLLDKLAQRNIIDQATCTLAKEEPLPSRPFPLPRFAPHLLNKVIKDGKSQQRITTTIDTKLQQYTLHIGKKYATHYAHNYINNVAILVLDTKSGDILSYVGNVDIPGIQNAPYVDNMLASRSAGSILKPFLFAATLNDGEILPHSLIPDIPTRLGGYSPQNFDKKFSGSVEASKALAHSLNVPAVRELNEYGLDKFYGILQELGFSTITKSPSHYGLSLILGGGEVNLYETTSIYASLARSLLSYNANKGKYTSSDFRLANYLPENQHKESILSDKSIFSAGAVWCTLETLTSVNRPWDETGWENFASSHKIAWKTGTSFGSRDAWSIGVTPQYTVGVWVGNATGEGRPGLTGVTHAAPIMFELFKHLNPSKWFAQPNTDLILLEVCKKSGYRATNMCELDTIFAPKNGIKVKSCPYHQSIFLDSTQTLRVSGNCYPVNKMTIRSHFVLPPIQEYYYKKLHPNYMPLPPYKEGCLPDKESVIGIIEPTHNAAIYIPKGIGNQAGMVIFEAIHRNRDALLFWHIDNDYIAQTSGIHKIEVSPSVGNHILTIIDEKGNMIKRKFSILSK